jgi:quercetin dioxygenase-like cupin family protein
MLRNLIRSEHDEPDNLLEKREVIAETPGLRMVQLTLSPGESVPWHWHSGSTDYYIGLEGITVVETRAPRGRFELAPGQTCQVPPKRAHYVSGKDGGYCKVAILQGVGRYDFNPVQGPL